MAIEAYPLTWPEGWKRTTSNRRERGSFQVSLARARDGLLSEVKRLGGLHVVISSNLALRQDGLPYAQQRAIDDHGIALYFEYKGKPMCFACDRYTRMEANMRAIELTIAALRGIERWGASDMLERAFTGFAQLEHSPTQQWWDVLGISRHSSRDAIEAAWRRLRSAHHPDRDGGDHDIFLTVKGAYEQAIKERKP